MAVVVGLNEKQDRIWLRSPWYPGVAQECKRVTGARWAASDKVWTYPLTMDVCRQMRDVFGTRLEIEPGLSRWARMEVSREKEMSHLGSLYDSELKQVPLIAPRLAAAMQTRPYQKSGATFIAAGKWISDFDEPGLGKTATALAGIMEAGLWLPGTKHLVIAPKTAVQSTWPQEFAKWTDDANVFAMTVDGQAARKRILGAAKESWSEQTEQGPTFVVINPHMLQVKLADWCKKCNCWDSETDNLPDQGEEHFREGHKTTKEIIKQDYPELQDTVWDTIIADECHKYMLKIRPHTKGKMPQWAEGLVRLKTAPKGLRIPMTGTPFRGKEYNMFGILHWMNPKKYGSYWNWVDSFLEKSDNGFGIVVGGARPERREEFDRALATNTLRRTRAEVRSELPEQMPVDHWVPLEGKHKKQYEEFTLQGVVMLENGEAEGLGVLSEITRLRQFSFGVWDMNAKGKMIPTGESPKIDLILDMLEERGLTKDSELERHKLPKDQQPEDLKFVIASQFVEILMVLNAKLEGNGIHTMLLTGRQTGKDRARVVNDFSTPGGPRVLLLSTTAGGESITLDAWCEEMFILDETHVEDDQVQLRGRIDNRGDKIATRFYHYIRTYGTIEEGIAQSNIGQWNMQAELLDRRRGIEVAVRLLKGGS